ncbi:MAG: hypothetical protein CMJ34_04330 [Phycisphaerae bacterium]|nr:hypothetical protein [Phycisphaerae bacterium]
MPNVDVEIPVESPGPSKRRTHVETPMSWAFSIMIHLGVLLVASVITWSIVRTPEDRPIVVLSNPEAVPSLEAVSTLSADTPEPSPAGGSTSASAREPVEAADLASLLVSADDLLSMSTTLDVQAGSGELPGISFGGVAAPAATRIVFVVDASGSMIGAFPAVVKQVERTLRQLESRQSFSVLLFREGEMLEVPGRGGRLRPASPQAIDEAIVWMESRTPRGRSDPSAALRRAFNLDPEVVYLVSTDITGSGAYEIDREELFALLDEINPRDSNGRRRAVIRCIQLLEEDSLETLQEISRRHGAEDDGSDNGFAFIDRKSLGLD